MKALTPRLALVGACSLGAVSAVTPVSVQTACADLAGGTFGNAIVLETEETLGSTAVETAYGGGAILDRPICRVRGRIQPSSDSDIGFEVWLPEEGTWNGRYQGAAPSMPRPSPVRAAPPTIVWPWPRSPASRSASPTWWTTTAR